MDPALEKANRGCSPIVTRSLSNGEPVPQVAMLGDDVHSIHVDELFASAN